MKQNRNRVLKIAAAMLLASSLTVQAQNVSFNNERLTLKQAFEKIESVSNYKIAYNPSQVNVNQQVELNQKDKTVTQVMEEMLRGTDYTFVVKGEQIVIVPKNADSQTKSKVDVKGRIIDEMGEGIIGASVIEKGTTNGVVTDIDGNFALTVDATSTLQISFIGYKTIEERAAPSMNITLHEDKQLLDEVVVVGYGV